MTGDELKRARHALGLSVDQFADLFGVASGRTVRGWEIGERNGEPTKVPQPVALLVRLALEYEAVRQWLASQSNKKGP